MSAKTPVIARERSHTMIVGSGLYVLRYASAGADNDFPIVGVRPSANSDAGISLLPAPGRKGFDLASPGDCILVRAERPGALEVTVSAATKQGSLEAEVRLERITSRPTEREAWNSGSERIATPDVRILSHVAKRGDAVCEQGEWIGGADHPACIEGIEVQWSNKPADVELHYTVTVDPQARRRLQEKVAGEYAGTRGKTMPLVGLTLALSGSRARDYELRADALFQGSAVLAKEGAEIALSGPTGREPLVGLRLTIVTARNVSDVAQPANRSDAVVMKQVGRVRVYRPGSVRPPKTREGVNRSVRV